ncbi:probable ADP ATP carrier protein at5g56450 [Phtheirospermum japonicum]|uniref:Probable ADP ATP carrier protein at5g56450 n=1 Tax=Phtheirospermum japonicum TaxID=374723 RepID=A0A830CYJ4_9LAMI|nr:probable ADP ATP carrier protein at5g56450 [Phtheirospermum japonicum]
MECNNVFTPVIAKRGGGSNTISLKLMDVQDITYSRTVDVKCWPITERECGRDIARVHIDKVRYVAPGTQ